MSSSDHTFNCVKNKLATMKDIMNKVSSLTTTSNHMFKSIEIDDHDMNDNNDKLSRDNDEYDIISTVNNMKMSSYLTHHYICAIKICMILIRLIFINFITIDKIRLIIIKTMALMTDQ